MCFDFLLNGFDSVNTSIKVYESLAKRLGTGNIKYIQNLPEVYKGFYRSLVANVSGEIPILLTKTLENHYIILCI